MLLTVDFHSRLCATIKSTSLTNLFHINGSSSNRTATTISTFIISAHLNSTTKETFASFTTNNTIMTSKDRIGWGYVITDDTYITASRTFVASGRQQGRRFSSCSHCFCPNNRLTVC